MTKRIGYSPEVKDRAVRMLLEHQEEYPSQWQAICSIAAKIVCPSETLRSWLHQTERNQGMRAGLTAAELDRLWK